MGSGKLRRRRRRAVSRLHVRPPRRRGAAVWPRRCDWAPFRQGFYSVGIFAWPNIREQNDPPAFAGKLPGFDAGPSEVCHWRVWSYHSVLTRSKYSARSHTLVSSSNDPHAANCSTRRDWARLYLHRATRAQSTTPRMPTVSAPRHLPPVSVPGLGTGRALRRVTPPPSAISSMWRPSLPCAEVSSLWRYGWTLCRPGFRSRSEY